MRTLGRVSIAHAPSIRSIGNPRRRECSTFVPKHVAIGLDAVIEAGRLSPAAEEEAR
ncbi:hypothetical protein trd_A0584 (plasmid) [Thermomicrobium roseum DSM 5159]|uniref:Uncharacterized protein n=1 Tax=Thermomicrobium roseum (strain ATCC 27502 / DSM 5159 / P-2) TaxID=309801 RepID=B9L470_THERP|nr:hypothetical protein trd_A0584 [Thermomicrobium roseum DSM 5159]